MYSAIYGSANSNAQHPQHLCPTNNCTWDRFATLAYCPKCIDVSEHLDRTCTAYSTTPDLRQYCNVSFPGGSPWLAYTAAPAPYYMVDTYFNVEKERSAIALNTTGTEGYYANPFSPIWRSLRVDVSNTILETLDMKKNIYNDTRVIGTECAMLRCIHSIDAAVKDGIYQEEIVDTYYFEEEPYHGVMVTPPWGEEKGVRYNETFGMTPEAYDSAKASWVGLAGSAREADSGTGIGFDTDEIQAIFSANFTSETCDTPHDNFACVFKAIGSAM